METLYYAQGSLVFIGGLLLATGAFAIMFGSVDNGKKAKKVGFGIVAVGLTLLVLSVVAAMQPIQMYEYTIKAYYLGGSERIMTVISDKYGPQIDSYRGSYTLDTRFDGVYEQGVVRFEVISKRPIPEQ